MFSFFSIFKHGLFLRKNQSKATKNGAKISSQVYSFPGVEEQGSIISTEFARM